MKTITGVFLGFAGAFLGLWIGVWVMFIGGIVQVIESIKMVPISSLELACGAARVLFSGAAGWGIAWVLWTIASLIMED